MDQLNKQMRDTIKSIRDGMIAWMKNNVITTLTLAGIIVYAFLRIGYEIFYSQFGLRPEDVGLTYTDVLLQVPGLLVTMGGMLIAVCVFVAIGFVLYADWVIWRERRKRAHSNEEGERISNRSSKEKVTPGQIYIRWVAVIFSITILSGLVLEPWTSAWDVKIGISESPELYSGIRWAGWGAQRVSVEWVSDGKRQVSSIVGPTDCLMLLGRNENQTILFNVRNETTFRLPSNEIAVGAPTYQPARCDSAMGFHRILDWLSGGY